MAAMCFNLDPEVTEVTDLETLKRWVKIFQVSSDDGTMAPDFVPQGDFLIRDDMMSWYEVSAFLVDRFKCIVLSNTIIVKDVFQSPISCSPS